MSVPYKLLRKGAMYRIVYTTWKTNPRPVIFVLYSGPTKVHALSINSPNMSIIDARNFALFVKKMKAIKGVEGWTGRILYNTLRTYFSDIVRKSYRTFKTSNIAGMTLVSTGIIKEDIFTDYELSFKNDMLYNASQNDIHLRTVNNLTGTKYVPEKKPPLYVPQNVVIPKKEEPPQPPQPAQPLKPATPPQPEKKTSAPLVPPTGSSPIQPKIGDSFSVYGEE